MRIVCCIPQLFRAGGMERVLTQQVNALVQQPDVEVTIVTTESVPKGERTCFFPMDGRVRLVELALDFDADFRMGLLKKYIRHRHKQRQYRQRLKTILRDEKADVCISLGGKELEWLGSIDVPCRKLVALHTVHDYRSRLLLLYHSGWFWRMMGRYLDGQRVRQVRRMGELVVLNRVEQQWWQSRGVGRVYVIPNACAGSVVDQKMPREKVVLAVGRLYPVKGFDLLLRAWSLVHADFPDWQLRIIGEGEQRAELESLADRLGIRASVQMPGQTERIDAEYGRSRIFVLSSRQECYPMALIEAMSHGCCPISFDCPNGPREMIDEGKTGRLVAPEDIDRLAAVLAEQMRDEVGSDEIGRMAAMVAQQRWSESVVMTQWLRLLRQE